MKTFGQRKGKIVFGRDFLDSLTASDIAKIFRHFFVISICDDWLAIGDNRVYYGVSPFFDEIEKGAMVPEYTVEVYRKPHDEINWTDFESFKDPVKYEINSVKFIRRKDPFEPNEVKREHKLML